MIDTVKRHELQRLDVERIWASHLTASVGEPWHQRYIGRHVIPDFLADVSGSDSSGIQRLVIDQPTIVKWMIRDVAGIRKLFEYIAAREPLLIDHCHQIVAIPKKRGAALPAIRYLEKDQLGAILGGVSRESSMGRRDYTLLLFMYNTGARVQEVADTRVTWLSLTPPFKVDLLGKGRKWRTCPLWESTVQHLRQLIEERKVKPGEDGFLFVNPQKQPLSRSGIANLIARYTAKAAATTPGLQSHKVTPHTFRHTTAMHLLQSGVEVNVIRSWLGHASITTTNRYIEIDLAMKRKALETCEVGASGALTEASWRSDVDILAWLESL